MSGREVLNFLMKSFADETMVALFAVSVKESIRFIILGKSEFSKKVLLHRNRIDKRSFHSFMKYYYDIW